MGLVNPRQSPYPPMAVSVGEPAGIGPDVCLLLAREHPELLADLVFIGCLTTLRRRQTQLGLTLDVQPANAVTNNQCMRVIDCPCRQPVEPGVLNSANAPAVFTMLNAAIDGARAGRWSAVVTGPVHKGVLAEVQPNFQGHTEYFAERLGVSTKPLMLLVSAQLRVALVTTHVAINAVAGHITQANVFAAIRGLHQGLSQDFGLTKPHIAVAGLNPHAGEGGLLGDEEITDIAPAIAQAQALAINVSGPFSGDTIFQMQPKPDVFLMMYHDQGLAVFKYASFGSGINTTLGLPIVRTSVDHGVALDLAAGRQPVSTGSLYASVCLAEQIVHARAAIRA